MSGIQFHTQALSWIFDRIVNLPLIERERERERERCIIYFIVGKERILFDSVQLELLPACSRSLLVLVSTQLSWEFPEYKENTVFLEHPRVDCFLN